MLHFSSREPGSKQFYFFHIKTQHKVVTFSNEAPNLIVLKRKKCIFPCEFKSSSHFRKEGTFEKIKTNTFWLQKSKKEFAKYSSICFLFLCHGNQLITFLRYETIKCINHGFPKWPGPLWGVTCFGLGWRLAADFVSLEGPYVDGVKNPRLQTNHLVRAAVASHWNLSTGALRGRVAQHVALNFCLDSIPGDRHCVLCYFSGHQVGWSVEVWAGRDQDDVQVQSLQSWQCFGKNLEHNQHTLENWYVL